ncbi:MAG: polysaccharide biosynthesis tyrosine autokinase [Clostridia bacterium]|nr:polysaccharide biosynthesis tyrosine autokinase [Clostridia bacterium]
MNNEVTNETSRSKITLSSLLGALKKFWIIICIATLLCAIVFGAYAKLSKPSYTASAKFQVVNVLPTNAYISDAMLNAAAGIATNCVEIINSQQVIEKAVTTHKLDEYFGVEKHKAISMVSGMVSASKADSESAIFTISVTTGNRDTTHTVICAMQDIFPEFIENDHYNVDDEKNQIATKVKPLKLVDTEYPIDVHTVNKSVTRHALIGGVLAAVASYLICFFIFINDTKVYDDATIKSRFSTPVIGIIPEWTVPGDVTVSKRSKKRGVMTGDKRDYKGKLLTSSTPFAVTEAFNTLRTNLCYSTAAEKCPVFAITSDFSGAGKSVISANIATSLALLGKKTLLIECDLRRPELSEVFNVEKRTGLSEFLTGAAPDAESVIANINNENLDVIFSGRIPPNPSELLGSDKMAQLITSCKEKYDIIIIDTPPAFEVSDIGVIVPLLTGTVMVARSNYSDLNAIEESAALITGVNGRIVGYVVNDVDLKSGGSYYHKRKYGYRKYKRYYSSYSSAPTSSEQTDGATVSE